jgi:IS30 family transposase
MRSHLRLRGKARRKKWHLYHGTFCARPNISLRPEAANTREKYGHWEMDLFVGSRGQKASALVLVERKSRYSLIRRLPDQSQRSVLDALGDLAPKLLIKSITTDNGSEFLNHETLARLVGAPVFYCNPYHAWEKGTVENTIGLYREFFKKGERMPDNLNLFSRAQHLINSRPRKVLGFRTATSLLDNIIS